MKSPQPSTVSVKIYDREYTLRTSGDSDQLQYLSAQLDSRMRAIAKESGTVDSTKVAVLAALSLADDLQRCREELQRMDESVGKRSLECVTILDRFLH